VALDQFASERASQEKERSRLAKELEEAEVQIARHVNNIVYYLNVKNFQNQDCSRYRWVLYFILVQEYHLLDMTPCIGRWYKCRYLATKPHSVTSQPYWSKMHGLRLSCW